MVIDFTGLGEQGHVGLMGSSIHGSVIDDERVSHVATRLVKPVPSVPEYHHLANAQIISRMPPVSATNSDKSGSNSLFARPGSAGNHIISSLLFILLAQQALSAKTFNPSK